MPTTDEGVSYTRVDAEQILNASATTDVVNAKRRELHVSGKTYAHVGETAGQWLYRWECH